MPRWQAYSFTRSSPSSLLPRGCHLWVLFIFNSICCLLNLSWEWSSTHIPLHHCSLSLSLPRLPLHLCAWYVCVCMCPLHFHPFHLHDVRSSRWFYSSVKLLLLLMLFQLVLFESPLVLSHFFDWFALQRRKRGGRRRRRAESPHAQVTSDTVEDEEEEEEEEGRRKARRRREGKHHVEVSHEISTGHEWRWCDASGATNSSPAWRTWQLSLFLSFRPAWLWLLANFTPLLPHLITHQERALFLAQTCLPTRVLCLPLTGSCGPATKKREREKERERKKKEEIGMRSIKVCRSTRWLHLCTRSLLCFCSCLFFLPLFQLLKLPTTSTLSPWVSDDVIACRKISLVTSWMPPALLFSLSLFAILFFHPSPGVPCVTRATAGSTERFNAI